MFLKEEGLKEKWCEFETRFYRWGGTYLTREEGSCFRDGMCKNFEVRANTCMEEVVNRFADLEQGVKA